MLTLAENVIVSRADNRPPMLDKTQYSSWASRMLLYIKGKEHGKLLLDSILHRPFRYGTVADAGTTTTPATVKDRTYDELTNTEKIHEACDIKATNIVLQGLPQDIYNPVNHHKEAKDIWDRVKLLIKGSEISLQERESKLYDEFDTFTSVPGEIIHSYYLRFAKLINYMHSIGMTMKPIQINTKFVNHLQPEWSKFVTDVKLAKDFHNTNFDHLYGYLRQHEIHAKEVPQTRPRNSTWFKKKGMLAEALESRVVLDEEQMAFLADNGDTITKSPSGSAVHMAKLPGYDSDVLSEVPTHDTYQDNQVIDQKTENAVVQDTSSTQQDALMSVIEEMYNQVAKCNEVDKHIICQDVMSIVLHADVESKNVLPVNNNSIEYDNLEAELLKKENDRLLKLLISQDLVHTAMNTLATVAN
ncbi:hypothetical protein Tco_0696047 [Tanacetum coccineum]